METIFDSYVKDELLHKLNELNFFCFYRGRLSPYGTDTDKITTHLSYQSKEDLINKLHILGVTVKLLKPTDEISFGKNWPDCQKYPTPSMIFPDIAEPYKQTIFNEEVVIFIADKYFSISISNSDDEKWWLINSNHISSALRLEKKLIDLGMNKFVTLEGQKEYGMYINRFHYPELFIDENKKNYR